ncbi:MAG TPA: 1-acyl-sn-glycerol-3-phosphate acyltransferase [Pirellulales bacterium]
MALAVLAAVVFIVWWKRSSLTLYQTLLWTLNYLVAKCIWRTKVEGALPVGTGAGAVIVANHRSGVDPSFIQTCTRRVVYWMVAREYCEMKFVGALLRAFQVIPVGRGGVDTAATKHAIRLAQEGGLVGMFPEGRINLKGEPILLPGRPGAALVALKARVPIIPVWITGAPYDGTALGPLKMRAKVRVQIGQPIDISAYYGREKEEGVKQEITKIALRELAKLGGQSDFEPQLAGRNWTNENGEANGEASENGSQPSTSNAPTISSINAPTTPMDR